LGEIMAASNVQSGTQAATVSTRHQLGTTVTAAGVYQLKVDTNAMATGDSVTLEVEAKTASGSTRRVKERMYLAGVQSTPVIESLPHAEPVEVAFFLTQTAGTGRSFDWAIVAL